MGNLPEALVSLESLGQIPWLEKSLSPGNVSAGGRSGVGVTEKSTLFECFFFFSSAERFQNNPHLCLNVSFQDRVKKYLRAITTILREKLFS